jgi:hypothetical protein
VHLVPKPYRTIELARAVRSALGGAETGVDRTAQDDRLRA